MLVGTVGGGLLGQVDLSIPYLVRTVLLVAVFAVAYVVMHDLGFTPRRVKAGELPGEIARNAKAGVAFGWAQPPLRLLMLAALVQMGFFTWAFYAQPYMLDLLGERRGLGLGAGHGGYRLVDHPGEPARRGLLEALRAPDDAPARGRRGGDVRGGRPRARLVVLGRAPALLLITAATGVTSPVRQAYLHQVVPSEQRATVVSFDSMVSNAGGIGGQVGLGALGESRSIGAAFVAGGLVTGLALPLVARVRALGGDADRIGGQRGGIPSPCQVPASRTWSPCRRRRTTA